MNRRNDNGNGNGTAMARREPIERLFGRMPPVAIEEEMSVLGAMILDWRVCGDVIQTLGGAEDFYTEKHAAIYESLIELYDQNQSLDLTQLHRRLSDKQQLELVGGVDYLEQLAESVPNAASVRHYARVVRDKAIERELIDAAAWTLRSAYEAHTDTASLVDEAEQRIFRVSQLSERRDSTPTMSELMQDTYDEIEAEDGRHVTGLDTGFFDLNDITRGFHPGEMIVVAARPSMGKTAFALNIAEHVAVTNKMPCALFSMEMSRKELAKRLMCARAEINSHRLQRNMLNDAEFGRLAEASGALSQSPMQIDDAGGLTLMQLRAKARRMATRHGIKAIFIDYLQLMSGPKSESRQQEVSALSRGIKALARELSVPIICLSQLNRASENRASHKPLMSDLRESGSIEQDADVVIMLHREDYYAARENPNHEPTRIAEVIIAKQRNGPTGTVELVFDSATTKFRNKAKGGMW